MQILVDADACPVKQIILLHRFDRYVSKADKRLVKVTPTNASYIILANGAGFVINFYKDEATSIQR